MSIKISELPQATSVGSSDIVPIVQGGTTKQATAKLINIDSYSTTEQKVGTWIDGKPIYEITYQLTCPTTSSGEVTQDITNLNLETLTDICGTSKYINNDGVTKYYRPFENTYAYNSQLGNYSGAWIKDNTLFFRYSGFTAILSLTAYITIRYTKTTTRSLNLTKSENTGSLVGLGDKAEVTDETLEKVKLDETTEVKEVEATEQTKEAEGSGDLIK